MVEGALILEWDEREVGLGNVMELEGRRVVRLAELSRREMKVWGMEQSYVCWQGVLGVVGMGKAVQNGGVPCLARAVLGALWGVEGERGKDVHERCDKEGRSR